MVPIFKTFFSKGLAERYDYPSKPEHFPKYNTKALFSQYVAARLSHILVVSARTLAIYPAPRMSFGEP